MLDKVHSLCTHEYWGPEHVQRTSVHCCIAFRAKPTAGPSVVLHALWLQTIPLQHILALQICHHAQQNVVDLELSDVVILQGRHAARARFDTTVEVLHIHMHICIFSSMAAATDVMSTGLT